MDHDAQQHGPGHNDEDRAPFVDAALQHEESEDDRCQASRTKPAEKCDGVDLEPHADHGNSDRHHANDGQAQHRVERDLPREVAEGGPDERPPENHEREEHQQLPLLLRELE